MMTKQALQRMMPAAAGVFAILLAGAPMASAAVSTPKIARGFTTWMVRAMDQCSSPPNGLTVTSPNVPSSACPQANSNTDGTVNLSFAKLRITQAGMVGLFGTGVTSGTTLKLQLDVRVTRPNQSVAHQTSSKESITFADQIVTCPMAFAARPNGAVAGRTTLTACFGSVSGLAGTGSNIEIVSAALINAANNKAVAVPGILR